MMRGSRQDCLDSNEQWWASTSSRGQIGGWGNFGPRARASSRAIWLGLLCQLLMRGKVPGVCVNCRWWGHHLVENFSVGGITQPANLNRASKSHSLPRHASGASEKSIYLVWCGTLCNMLTPTVWNQLNLVQTPWLETKPLFQMCLFQAGKQNEK